MCNEVGTGVFSLTHKQFNYSLILYVQVKHTIVIYYLYIIRITNDFKVWLYSLPVIPRQKPVE